MTKTTLEDSIKIDVFLDENENPPKNPDDYEKVTDCISAAHNAIGLVADWIQIGQPFKVGIIFYV